MSRQRLTAALAATALAGLAVALAATPTAQAGGADKGTSAQKSPAEVSTMKDKNEATLAWFRDHGIDVHTVVKDGYTWASPTEADLKAAAAAKGTTYQPKSGAKKSK